jgi:Tol biopolymer transport system component
MRLFYLTLIILIICGCAGVEIKKDIKGGGGDLLISGKVVVIKPTSEYPYCELGIMKTDGGGYYPILKHKYIKTPRWSSDGKKIVFKCIKERIESICIINADGTKFKEIYSNRKVFNPSFSPDGEQIIFVEGKEVYTIHIDGTNLKQLTNMGEIKKGNIFIKFWKDYPSFSPDGKKIAFYGRKDIYDSKSRNIIKKGESSLFIMNTDGSGLKMIASFQHSRIFRPHWSWDSKKIGVGGDGIYVVNSDGTNLRKITRKKSRSISNYAGPYWLSNNKIVYTYSISTDWPFYLWENRTELYIADINDVGKERMIKKFKDSILAWDWWIPRAKGVM